MTQGRYHLAGVAGSGMSALAQILLAEGRAVSGSDRHADAGRDLAVLRQLASAGVRLFPQDGSGVRGAGTVVISTAVEDDNPDRVAARRLGVPLVHRSETLAALTEGRRCIAVTGTSGKSTVTGMIGWTLEQLGADPTVVNGAVLLDWRRPDAVGNARHGRSGLWVIEADESDRSLLNYAPEWAVVTNASADHFGLAETLELFRAFRERVGTGVVSTVDEPALLRGFEPELSADRVAFRYGGLDFAVPLPGRHNAENALCAVLLCERMGLDLTRVRDALARFRGLQRRLQTVGRRQGVTVMDDSAHNPAKIGAAWRAVAPYYRRVLGVWRPHGYGPLAAMKAGLAKVFAELCRAEDRLYILPVYDAGGTADRSVHAGMLVDELRARGLEAGPAEFDRAPARVAADARPGDLVLVMGARDPALPELAERILASLE